MSNTTTKGGEIQQLIDDLEYSKPEIIQDTLQGLTIIAQSQRSERLIPYIPHILEKLECFISKEHEAVLIESLKLLQELTNQHPTEIAEEYDMIICKLILNLGDSRPVIRKLALNNLATFCKLVEQGFDMTLEQLLNIGVNNSNAQIRSRVIASVAGLVSLDPEIMQNSAQFKLLMEGILDRSQSDEQNVQTSVTYLVHHMMKNYSEDLESFVERLVYYHQEIIREIMNEPDVFAKGESQQSMSPSKKNSLKYTKPKTPGVQSKVFESKKRITESHGNLRDAINRESQSNIKYGIFKATIIEDSESDDWKVRSASTDEVLAQLEKTAQIDSLIPHLEEFTKLVIKLLDDTNFKICINALNLCGVLIKRVETTFLRTQIEKIVKALLVKLSESKIAVRQIAIQTLLEASKKMDMKHFINLILLKLLDSNWHVREESLILIRMIIEEHKLKFGREYNFKVIDAILDLFYDQKSKVKQSAQEVLLDVIRCTDNPQLYLEDIKDQIDPDLFERYQERITDPSSKEPLGKTFTMAFDEKNNSRDIQSRQYDRASAGSNMSGFERYTINSRFNTGNVRTASSNAADTIYNKNSTSIPQSPLMTSHSPYRPGTNYSNGNTDQFGMSHLSNFTNNMNSEDKMYGGYFSPSPYKADFGSTGSEFARGDSQIKSRGSSKSTQRNIQNTVSPSQLKSYGMEVVSTASSSHSGYSRRTNTIYSMDSTSSNLSNEKYRFAKFGAANLQNSPQPTTLHSKTNQQRYPSPGDRSYSAHNQGENKIGAPFDNNNSRTYSATDKLQQLNNKYNSGQKGRHSIGSRLPPKSTTNNTPVNNEIFLEYSTTKNLDEFSSNHFEIPSGNNSVKNGTQSQFNSTGISQYQVQNNNNTKQGLQNTSTSAYNNKQYLATQQLQQAPSYDPFQDNNLNETYSFTKENQPVGPSQDMNNNVQQGYSVKVKRNAQNPYRSGRNELSSKVKKLQTCGNNNISFGDMDLKRGGGCHANGSQHDQIVVGKGAEGRSKSTQRCEGNPFGVNRQNFDTAINENENENDDSINQSGFGLKTSSIPPKPRFSTTRKQAAKTSVFNENITGTEKKKATYLQKDELIPIEGSIDAAMKAMASDLKQDDWQRQFEGQNLLRRLLQNHIQQVTSSQYFNLHSIIQEILKQVDSLRSNLSKNALITLSDISNTLKKGLDSEAEPIILRLLKKSSDTSQFISDEVRKAIMNVAQNCSDTKIIPVFANMNNQKAIPAKTNICLGLESFIQKYQNKITQLRDFDRLVTLLGNYMMDGAVEVRNISKRAAGLILQSPFNKNEMDRILHRNFNEINYKKLSNIIDKDIAQNKSPLMITNSQSKRY